MIRYTSYHMPTISESILRAFDKYWTSGVTDAIAVNAETWQSQKKPMLTIELNHVNYQIMVPKDIERWQKDSQCNLPWAEDHFKERVAGIPYNPPPSEAYWPFAVRGNEQHKEGEIFSHTYPERYWPKMANTGETRPNGRQVFVPHNGIRYEYGDLEDVINLLRREPTTRQAYLPVWFPEDTGAVDGQRVPCSIGYHFIIRDKQLDCTYFLRSCDFMRHWNDDMYMSGRLMQWMAEQLEVNVRFLVCQIASLHVFEPDGYRIGQMVDELEKEAWGAV